MATIIQDGASEDLIRTFTQLTCAEGHYKTLIEKYNSELNEGLIDTVDSEAVAVHMDLLNDAMDELLLISEIRRSVMLDLLDIYQGDKNYWCIVKHLAQAAYCAFEAYQASDNDGALLTRYLEINARFVKAITRFLGTEITSCASCFGDILKGKGGLNNG